MAKRPAYPNHVGTIGGTIPHGPWPVGPLREPACTGLASTLKRLPSATGWSYRSPSSSTARSARSVVRAGPTSRSPLSRSASAARSQDTAWVGNKCPTRPHLPSPARSRRRRLAIRGRGVGADQGWNLVLRRRARGPHLPAGSLPRIYRPARTEKAEADAQAVNPRRELSLYASAIISRWQMAPRPASRTLSISIVASARRPWSRAYAGR